MASSFYSVSFTDLSGEAHVSRIFATLRAARSWSRFLAKQDYIRAVAIHRGGPGGERLA